LRLRRLRRFRLRPMRPNHPPPRVIGQWALFTTRAVVG
jgi:hypothetical protein